jgi:hypothetical protein
MALDYFVSIVVNDLMHQLMYRRLIRDAAGLNVIQTALVRLLVSHSAHLTCSVTLQPPALGCCTDQGHFLQTRNHLAFDVKRPPEARCAACAPECITWESVSFCLSYSY